MIPFLHVCTFYIYSFGIGDVYHHHQFIFDEIFSACLRRRSRGQLQRHLMHTFHFPTQDIPHQRSKVRSAHTKPWNGVPLIIDTRTQVPVCMLLEQHKKYAHVKRNSYPTPHHDVPGLHLFAYYIVICVRTQETYTLFLLHFGEKSVPHPLQDHVSLDSVQKYCFCM